MTVKTLVFSSQFRRVMMVRLLDLFTYCAVFDFASIDRLSNLVDKLYRQTSKRLLDIMFSQFKLLEHLIALKKYMLLGQGDFIQCLLVDLE